MELVAAGLAAIPARDLEAALAAAGAMLLAVGFAG
jgi:mannose/fructose/N-acetylgalactosamine-specific phosphotransferase system component IIC